MAQKYACARHALKISQRAELHLHQQKESQRTSLKLIQQAHAGVLRAPLITRPGNHSGMASETATNTCPGPPLIAPGSSAQRAAPVFAQPEHRRHPKGASNSLVASLPPHEHDVVSPNQETEQEPQACDPLSANSAWQELLSETVLSDPTPTSSTSHDESLPQAATAHTERIPDSTSADDNMPGLVETSEETGSNSILHSRAGSVDADASLSSLATNIDDVTPGTDSLGHPTSSLTDTPITPQEGETLVSHGAHGPLLGEAILSDTSPPIVVDMSPRALHNQSSSSVTVTAVTTIADSPCGSPMPSDGDALSSISTSRVWRLLPIIRWSCYCAAVVSSSALANTLSSKPVSAIRPKNTVVFFTLIALSLFACELLLMRINYVLIVVPRTARLHLCGTNTSPPRKHAHATI